MVSLMQVAVLLIVARLQVMALQQQRYHNEIPKHHHSTTLLTSRRRSIMIAGLLTCTSFASPIVNPAWSSGWQDYVPAPAGSTTDEIIQSATEKASALLVETVRSSDGSNNKALPPSEALGIAKKCYLECFRKFGDSIVASTEYDVSVYCTSRCFEEVATSAFGLEKGSPVFCRSYAEATDLEFYGCD